MPERIPDNRQPAQVFDSPVGSPRIDLATNHEATQRRQNFGIEMMRRVNRVGRGQHPADPAATRFEIEQEISDRRRVDDDHAPSR